MRRYRRQTPFRFIKGPVFAQLLMADEINRASPRTQSALLQAMQEHHVTVAGERHDLPAPFHVLATQNPLEQEGTYPAAGSPARPLPAADRCRLSRTARPSAASCWKPPAPPSTSRVQAMTAETLMSIQRLVRRLPVGEAVVDAILDLVRSARPGDGERDTDKRRLGSRPARQPGADARLPAPALSTKAGLRPRSTTSPRWPNPC
jgi:MoxR-like ATPase